MGVATDHNWASGCVVRRAVASTGPPGGNGTINVTAQIFGVRANEIMLFSQPRPVRSVHMSEGWTPETIAQIAAPALRHHFMALERSPEAIDWDPI